MSDYSELEELEFEYKKMAQEKNDGEVLLLGSTSPNFPTTYFEVTINYPRTKAFLNKTSEKQKQIYRLIWHNIKCTLGQPESTDFTFEACKTGQIHLHGYIGIKLENIIPAILICDLAKNILKCLPKKYANFNEANYYPDYKRFRNPAICIQNSSSIDKWKEYIYKNPV